MPDVFREELVHDSTDNGDERDNGSHCEGATPIKDVDQDETDKKLDDEHDLF